MLLELSAGPPHVQLRHRAVNGEMKNRPDMVNCRCLDAVQYGNIDFVGDVRDLERLVPAASCSEIFWVHGPEHLPYHEHIPMLQRIWRTLQPGGWFRASLPDIRYVTEHFPWDAFTDAQFLDFRWRMYGQAECHPVYQVHFSGWWNRYALLTLAVSGFINNRIVPRDEWWTQCPPMNLNFEGQRPL